MSWESSWVFARAPEVVSKIGEPLYLTFLNRLWVYVLIYFVLVFILSSDACMIGADWNGSYIMNIFRVTLDDLGSIWMTLAIARRRGFGRRRVVERPRVGNSVSHHLFTRCLCWDCKTWDWAGPLGGKWRTIGWEGREWYAESWHLQGCSPHSCQLRTKGLAPVIKYWTHQSHARDIGPVSLVASCR
jgi:hypothetical protein